MEGVSHKQSNFASKVVALLMERKWPRDEATMVVDLALHASNQALEAITRVADTSKDDRMKTQVLVLAAQIVIEKSESVLDFAKLMIEVEGKVEK